MTAVVSFDREEISPVDIGSSEPGPEPEPGRESHHSLRWAWVPAIISVAVNAIFLVAWWLPEFSNFPGHQDALTQLWPLAAKELTSAGQAVVQAQVGRSGVLAALMLITSLAVPFLVRNPSWVVRIVVPMASVYVGVVAWVVTMLGLLARGTLSQSWVGMILMTGWVLAAAVTVWRSLFAQVDELPPRPTRILWVVGLFALLYPVPLAAGRALFAPELTPAARSLLDTDPTLRIAALNDVSTLVLYLSGVFLALTVWALYMLLPPLLPIRVPWVRRGVHGGDPLVVRVIIAAVCILGLAISGLQASETGKARAEQLESGSPASDLLTCSSWTRSQPGRPTVSLVARGDHCRHLAAYVGYDQSAGTELATSVTPMRASTPDDRTISSRVVSAQYGAHVVLATSTRLDSRPDELVAVKFDTATQQWSFRCDDDGPMKLRFARADTGDDAAAGRVTQPGDRATVVVTCTNQQQVRLDPRTGQAVG